MYFGAIINKLEKVKQLNQHQMLSEIISEPEIQNIILDLNHEQLYDEGVQADGSPTGDYSLKTISLKLAYGDYFQTPGRIDHITGVDTGQMYLSRKVEVLPEGFKITAMDRGRFFLIEPKALGLTEKSLQKLRPYTSERFKEKFAAAL